MKLTTLGGAGMVTGSSYLIETQESTFLLDYGMYQGGKEEELLNHEPIGFEPADVDFLILSHAHIDHSGRIPLLVKQGFKGNIYATQATVDLSHIMLMDSAKIQEQDVEWENARRLRSGKPLVQPLYTSLDAEFALKHFVPNFYDTDIQITPSVRIRFRDAGHILGSSIVEIWVTEGEKTTKIVFSGDLGMPGKPIIKDPTFIDDADYLIMETTYGNTVHEPQKEAFEKLMAIIMETAEKNGTVVIPAFSVGRTQEIIYQMNEWFAKEDVSESMRIPVYVDSPMAKLATEAFMRNAMSFDEDAQALIRSGDNPFTFSNLHFTKDVEESKMLNKTNFPRVIISASGMATAGRVRHHLKHHLWQPNSAVVFVGFQAEGTLGRMLEDGVKEVKILGEEIAVKARIENVDGFSGHADRPMLLSWLEHFKKKPKKIFLVHGEAEQMVPFSEEIKRRWGMDVAMPVRGEQFTLTQPEDSVAVVPDPVVQNATVKRELEQLAGSIGLVERLQSRLSQEPPGTRDYETIQRKILSIQRDLLDLDLLLGN